ncbi:DUF4440 domain-containing protein [uncultured Tateyamaria sp.]|uniref:DUF4440 domain-containing protein n=1 Tax=uncultured Tateyamaria sp. TaxID=455651 RepID=UPI00261AD21F|nr:DUF4440 domain-containing protein [uncultured Tateyamaria sp.]
MKPIALAAAIACAIPFVGQDTSLAQERHEVPPFRTYGAVSDQAHADSIVQFLAAFRTAWAGQDIDALTRLHASDTEWINAYARIFQGRAPLMNFLRDNLFPTFGSEVSQTEMQALKPISIRYLGEYAAVLHLYADSRRGASRNPGEDLRRTHIHLVLNLDRQGWQIVHTAIMDAR